LNQLADRRSAFFKLPGFNENAFSVFINLIYEQDNYLQKLRLPGHAEMEEIMKKIKSQAIFDQSDFPINLVRTGVLKGTGADVTELAEKPLIAVVNSYSEFNAGHVHLKQIAQRVKEGIHSAGGIPFEFDVPAPCDGITEGNEGMRFVLPQRDLIADIIETHVRSQLFDGMVMISTCDKINPGMIMAAARLDLPTIFYPGGPSSFQIRYSPSMKGPIHYKYYSQVEDQLLTTTISTCGACETMGTANTFQCLSEALGIAIPGTANIPAFHSEKLLWARIAGKRIVEMIQANLTARQILTMQALENAMMVSAAIGGSTNVTLHLPAIAQELGFEMPLCRFNEFADRIPTITGIAPNGPYGIIDLYAAGGIPALMKVLEKDLHLDAINVMGETVKQVVDRAVVKDSKVIPSREKPFSTEGGTVVLFGNLAPEGAVVKQSAVPENMRVFKGKVKVFEAESDCLTAIRDKKIQNGDILVIRNEGPKGGPGMPEMLAVTLGLDLNGYKNVALLTDGRYSGTSGGLSIGHISPESYVGGPIAALRDGDEVLIDIPARKIEMAVSEGEIKTRLSNWKPRERNVPVGYMQRYVKYVTSAAKGAVLK
jgi:dihydroxy-acid dehydratase